MKMTHLGSGIVRFDEVFGVDPENFEGFKKDLELTIPQQNKVIDEDGSVRTSGGYKIEGNHFKDSPTRYTNLQTLNDSNKNFVSILQQAMHDCVVEYCKIFPVVIENIRWVTNGYVIKYENGQSIGPHSDCNIAYDEDNVTPINTTPIYNILTVGAFLNNDFAGGEISYRPWGIVQRPNVGSILIYPSSYIGCHEVAPVTQGARYAYLRWYGHGDAPSGKNESVFHLLENLKIINFEQKAVLVGEIPIQG
jgi:predicted 2-oxoglutarate/Fe(II)-dependent dioxygenase YbiX